MPWLETAPVDERMRFIQDALSDRFTMSELCARYGVSRRVGYKWVARYEEEGRRGLHDRSRAPHHCPHRIPEEHAELLCELRREHPHWGARKLLRILATRHPGVTGWPAPSTAADLLARRGLVLRRRHRRPQQHPGVVPPTTAAPNDLWTADFKGEFRTGNGVYCFPLTIADQHTRYLLTCHGQCSSGRFEHTGCHARFAPTTGCLSPPRPSTGSPSSTSGGCGSAFSISASTRAGRRRTARTSACTARSNARRSAPSVAPVPRSSGPSMPSAASTTPCGRTSGETRTPPSRTTLPRPVRTQRGSHRLSTPGTSS